MRVAEPREGLYHRLSMSSPRRFPATFLSAAILAGAFLGCGGGPPWPEVPPEVVAPPFVELVRWEGQAPTGAGAHAEGGPGDWVLRNEHLWVVVSGGRDTAAFAGAEGAAHGEGGAVVLDAGVPGGGDLLRRFVTVAGTGGMHRVRYERIGPDSLGAGEAWSGARTDSAARVLVARGHVEGRPDLAVETRFLLAAGARALQVQTTVENRGTEPVADVWVGIHAAWTAAAPFVPGQSARKPQGSAPVPFVTASDGRTAYAWVDPDAPLRASVTDTGFTAHKKIAALAPGGRLVFRQRLVVTGGSWADAAAVAWRVRGEKTGWVMVRLVDRRDSPVAGVTVSARDEDGRTWARGRDHAEGIVALPVPAGRYEIRAEHPARRRAVEKGVEVAPERRRRVVLRLSDPARVRLAAADGRGRSVAAGWILTRLDEGGSAGAAIALRPAVTARELALKPGRYALLAYGGPTREIWRTEARLREARTARITAILPPVPPPDGWMEVRLTPPEKPAGDERIGEDAAGLGLPGAPGGAGLVLSGTPEEFGAEVVADADHPERLEAAWKEWLERGAKGKAPTALGSGEGPGAFRNFVRLEGAGVPSRRDAAQALREGRVMVTNGPLVEFTLDGVGVGSTVRTEAGKLTGHIRVTAARWVTVSRVTVLVNGREDAVFPVRETDRLVRFDEDVTLFLDGDSAVCIRVDGALSDLPAPSWKSLPGRPRAVAFTNPIGVVILGGPG